MGVKAAEEEAAAKEAAAAKAAEEAAAAKAAEEARIVTQKKEMAKALSESINKMEGAIELRESLDKAESRIVDCKVTKGLKGLGMKLKKEVVSYSIEAFNDMPEGVPNPALNADPPIEVGDRVLAINGVKVSTSTEIVGEVAKVEAGTVF